MTYADFDQDFEIWPLNETLATCSFSVDLDNNIVALESVNIVGRAVSASDFIEWLGASEADRITACAQEWFIEGGWQEVEEAA